MKILLYSYDYQYHNKPITNNNLKYYKKLMTYKKIIYTFYTF